MSRFNTSFWTFLKVFVLTFESFGFSHGDSLRDYQAIEIKDEAFEIGRPVKNFYFKSLPGASLSIRDLLPFDALIVVIRDPHCPIAKKIGPKIAKIKNAFENKNVKFLFLYIGDTLSKSEIEKDLKQNNGEEFAAHDLGFEIVSMLGAKTTTETYVIDSGLILRYRGAVDDQYALLTSKPREENSFLKNSINAVLLGRGKEISPAKTSAPGCVISVPKKKKKETKNSKQGTDKITYYKNIRPILEKKCNTCHSGAIGSIKMKTYPEVMDHIGMINFVVKERLMPPWFADDGTGPWKNDLSLSASERKLITDWVALGAPKGRGGTPLPKTTQKSRWKIGRPDAVLEIPEPNIVPATGRLDYKTVYVKTNFPEDRWIEKIQILPTAPEVVHHVLVDLGLPKEKRKQVYYKDRYLMGYAPGKDVRYYSKEAGLLLPKGASLRFRIHYSPIGYQVKDQLQMGMKFFKTPPKNKIETIAISNQKFAIPPHESNFAVEGHFLTKRNIRIYSVTPHMHYRGKSMLILAKGNDGKTRQLFKASNYNFNWQLDYIFKTPPFLQAGSKIKMIAKFDNSRSNPSNPNPENLVKWGWQSNDEMALAVIQYYVSN